MSVWYSVEGEISIKESAHCSLNKLLWSYGIEGRIYVTKCEKPSLKGINSFKVKWCNSLEGSDAFNEVNSIVQEILSFDRFARIDLNCEIRIIR